MKVKTFKVYVDGKLRLICGSSMVLMSNVIKLKAKYGEDRVTVKEFEENTKLTEKEHQEMKDYMDEIITKSKKCRELEDKNMLDFHQDLK